MFVTGYYHAMCDGEYYMLYMLHKSQ